VLTLNHPCVSPAGMRLRNRLERLDAVHDPDH
jgi:hypothetical protein